MSDQKPEKETRGMRGAGTIYEKGGRWCHHFPPMKDGTTGKKTRPRKWFDTKAEAEASQAALKIKVYKEKGVYTELDRYEEEQSRHLWFANR